MALLSDREAFDREGMRKVEDNALIKVMSNVTHAPNATIVNETDFETLDLALAAARRNFEASTPHTLAYRSNYIILLAVQTAWDKAISNQEKG